MDKVPWNRVILEEFISLAILTPEEETLIRTRAAGWSQVRQSFELNVSLATITRMVRKLHKEYMSLVPHSDILPADLDF